MRLTSESRVRSDAYLGQMPGRHSRSLGERSLYFESGASNFSASNSSPNPHQSHTARYLHLIAFPAVDGFAA